MSVPAGNLGEYCDRDPEVGAHRPAPEVATSEFVEVSTCERCELRIERQWDEGEPGEKPPSWSRWSAKESNHG